MFIHTYKFRQKCKCYVFFLIYKFCTLFPIDKNKVVFTNYYGWSGFSDNPKYIAQALLKGNKNLKIYWVLENKKISVPEGIKLTKLRSPMSFYHLATARVWVDSQRKRWFTPKRPGQFYVQTWHGCLGLKKIEMDAIDTYENKRTYLKERILDSRSIDLFISGASWFTNIIRKAFMYKGEVLETGTPRNDILLNNFFDTSSLKAQLNIDNDSKIILYAPTFRVQEDSLDAYTLQYEKLVKELNAKTGEKWILLIRLHPRLRYLSGGIKYSNHIIDVTNYLDMQELLLLADVLVTDYSSCIFDFAIQKKPGFIYASDIEEYKKDRNFYLDIQKLPFSISETTDELINKIISFDKDRYLVNLNAFFEKVGLCETGKASENIARIIEEKIEESV